ncbi:hypothetical protein Tco_0642992 [Tanacetum coccineum]
MTTPSPSPPISLSPPSAGERLARCTAPPAHSPPLPPSSGCLTQIQTLRIASTQALIDAVTAALPPPSLPPLPPSLSIPSPVDRRDDIPESEQPPRKRLYLSTIGSRYEIGESSEIAPMTVGEVNTKVVELAELHERDTQDLKTLWDGGGGDGMGGRIGGGICCREAHQTQLQLQSTLIQTQHQVHETRFQMQQAELAALRETDRRRQDQMDELLACDESSMRRARQPGQEVDFRCQEAYLGTPTGTEGVVGGLTRWIEKMESVFNISGCAIENQVKFATCTLLGAALTWWNGQIRTLGPEDLIGLGKYSKKRWTDKYCPQGEIKKLEIELWEP